MIENSLAGRLRTSYLMDCNYQLDYENYEATFLRPLFKSDESWYLIDVQDSFGDDTELTEKDTLRLCNKAMEEVDVRFHMDSRNNFISFDEDKWVPMYFRTAEESNDLLEDYLNFFCGKYLKKEINKRIPCDVKFNVETSSIIFLIPFTDYSPAIHINTVLHNWESANVFVDDITTSLEKMFPSKNKSFFKSR